MYLHPPADAVADPDCEYCSGRGTVSCGTSTCVPGCPAPGEKIHTYAGGGFYVIPCRCVVGDGPFTVDNGLQRDPMPGWGPLAPMRGTPTPPDTEAAVEVESAALAETADQPVLPVPSVTVFADPDCEHCAGGGRVACTARGCHPGCPHPGARIHGQPVDGRFGTLCSCIVGVNHTITEQDGLYSPTDWVPVPGDWFIDTRRGDDRPWLVARVKDTGRFQAWRNGLGSWFGPDVEGLTRIDPPSRHDTVAYRVWRQPDLTEGRAGHTPDPDLWASEQDAWDQINHLRGVQGAHPSTGQLRAQRDLDASPELVAADTWQAYVAAGGDSPDYTVRPVTIRGTLP